MKVPQEKPPIDGTFLTQLRMHAHRQQTAERGKKPIHKKPYKNSHPDQKKDGRLFPFSEIRVTGQVEFDARTKVPADALTLEMVYQRGRNVKNFPTGISHLPGPVRLLEEKEIAFVEHSNRIYGAFADHQAGADP